MKRLHWLLLLLLNVGCADPDAPAEPDAARPDAEIETLPTQRHALITTLRFAEESPDGVAPGFNLDALISTGREPENCRKADLVDPNGVEGIDNLLATIVPLLEQTGAVAAVALQPRPSGPRERGGGPRGSM